MTVQMKRTSQISRAIDIGLDTVKFSTGDSFVENGEQHFRCAWFQVSNLRLPTDQRPSTGAEKRGRGMQIQFNGTSYGFAEQTRKNNPALILLPPRVDGAETHLLYVAAAIKQMNLRVPRIDYLLVSLPLGFDVSEQKSLREKILQGIAFGQQRVEIGGVWFANSTLLSLIYTDSVVRVIPSARAARLILNVEQQRISWYVEFDHCVNPARSGSAEHYTSRSISEAFSKYLPSFRHITVDDALFDEVEASLCAGAPSLDVGGQLFSLSIIGSPISQIVDRGLTVVFQSIGSTDDVVDVVITGICARLYSSHIQKMVPHLRLRNSAATSADARFAGVRGMQLVSEGLRRHAFVE